MSLLQEVLRIWQKRAYEQPEATCCSQPINQSVAQEVVVPDRREINKQARRLLGMTYRKRELEFLKLKWEGNGNCRQPIEREMSRITSVRQQCWQEEFTRAVLRCEADTAAKAELDVSPIPQLGVSPDSAYAPPLVLTTTPGGREYYMVDPECSPFGGRTVELAKGSHDALKQMGLDYRAQRSPSEFLLVDGIQAAQTPGVVGPFAAILAEFDLIVEIGFEHGGFTLWLHKNKLPDTRLIAYDITFAKNLAANTCASGRGRPIEFRLGDCFSAGAFAGVAAAITGSRKALILCDGGNKIQEFQTYSPLLRSGDVIMCHDYSDDDDKFWQLAGELGWKGTPEVRLADILSSVSKHELLAYHQPAFRDVFWGAFVK